MAVDSEIRKRLLDKLQITPRALNMRIKRVTEEEVISREDAACVIAHEVGVSIADRLDTESLTRINDYTDKRKARTSAAAASPPPKKPAEKQTGSSDVKVLGTQIESLPGMSQAKFRQAQLMVEKVYPLLYLFENSVREVVARVLAAAHGSKWWDVVASAKEKEAVEGRRAKEGAEAWHSQKSAHPIYYTDLNHLAKIVNRQFEHFKAIFPRASWFDGLVDDVAVSRNEVAHMNPIKAADLRHLESAFTKWTAQMRSKAALIP